ncbi:hypothetical protein CEUSTIGMA_g148.t1 [Chlamydomonas eustigma]|uniref:Fanconi anemia group M protein n=1 Tax=Chlamydomonas eustigma TaxID=1157962 RepID=A0A250WPV9_9CHLO|nr:hypothetical protein CEUSTIGMA_g148.t1 [Chlamydomonas eustigma]|eukprot:GAX72692.1 hypothetical protein CEUSTIGMA_g148.t1 [Chlamydomonas eustigma]
MIPKGKVLSTDCVQLAANPGQGLKKSPLIMGEGCLIEMGVGFQDYNLAAQNSRQTAITKQGPPPLQVATTGKTNSNLLWWQQQQPVVKPVDVLPREQSRLQTDHQASGTYSMHNGSSSMHNAPDAMQPIGPLMSFVELATVPVAQKADTFPAPGQHTWNMCRTVPELITSQTCPRLIPPQPQPRKSVGVIPAATGSSVKENLSPDVLSLGPVRNKSYGNSGTQDSVPPLYHAPHKPCLSLEDLPLKQRLLIQKAADVQPSPINTQKVAMPSNVIQTLACYATTATATAGPATTATATAGPASAHIRTGHLEHQHPFASCQPSVTSHSLWGTKDSIHQCTSNTAHLTSSTGMTAEVQREHPLHFVADLTPAVQDHCQLRGAALGAVGTSVLDQRRNGREGLSHTSKPAMNEACWISQQLPALPSNFSPHGTVHNEGRLPKHAANGAMNQHANPQYGNQNWSGQPDPINREWRGQHHQHQSQQCSFPVRVRVDQDEKSMMMVAGTSQRQHEFKGGYTRCNQPSEPPIPLQKQTHSTLVATEAHSTRTIQKQHMSIATPSIPMLGYPDEESWRSQHKTVAQGHDDDSNGMQAQASNMMVQAFKHGTGLQVAQAQDRSLRPSHGVGVLEDDRMPRNAGAHFERLKALHQQQQGGREGSSAVWQQQQQEVRDSRQEGRASGRAAATTVVSFDLTKGAHETGAVKQQQVQHQQQVGAVQQQQVQHQQQVGAVQQQQVQHQQQVGAVQQQQVQHQQHHVYGSERTSSNLQQKVIPFKAIGSSLSTTCPFRAEEARTHAQAAAGTADSVRVHGSKPQDNLSTKTTPGAVSHGASLSAPQQGPGPRLAALTHNPPAAGQLVHQETWECLQREIFVMDSPGQAQAFLEGSFTPGGWYEQQEGQGALASGSCMNRSRAYEQPGSVGDIDLQSARWWVYPSNMAVREYQYRMVRTALFSNTLVCLPTGLGKTLIAAVVMCNYFRWFPRGKVVFVAPTRPLVAQQMEACHKIMGINKDDIVELTAAQNSEKRGMLWLSKRAFFCTPQILDNDLSKGVANPSSIVCLVVDECHRAVGNASMAKAVDFLRRGRARFRLLGLSATPGSSSDAIQDIIRTLMISSIEFRNEEDADVAPYCHSKEVEVVEVELGSGVKAAQAKLFAAMTPVIYQLVEMKAYSRGDVENIQRFSLLQAQEAYMSQAAAGGPKNLNQGRGDRGQNAFFLFKQAIFLSTLSEILTQSGPQPALEFLKKEMHSSKASFLKGLNLGKPGSDFEQCRQQLQALVACPHPKIAKLEQVVLSHFDAMSAASMSAASIVESSGLTVGAAGCVSRVIIFTTLRDSVQEIVDVLGRHSPVIKPRYFIGQGGGKSTSKQGGCSTALLGMKQADQKAVLTDFRDGKFNTLVATCIGEEGLDIPEVDLIVCCDSNASPTRNIQRMGRTGRHKDGRVVYILSAGREVAGYHTGLEKLKHLHAILRNASNHFDMSRVDNRMVPRDVHPLPVLLQIETPTHGSDAKAKVARGKKSGWKQPRTLPELFAQAKQRNTSSVDSTACAKWEHSLREGRVGVTDNNSSPGHNPSLLHSASCPEVHNGRAMQVAPNQDAHRLSPELENPHHAYSHLKDKAVSFESAHNTLSGHASDERCGPFRTAMQSSSTLPCEGSKESEQSPPQSQEPLGDFNQLQMQPLGQLCHDVHRHPQQGGDGESEQPWWKRRHASQPGGGYMAARGGSLGEMPRNRGYEMGFHDSIIHTDVVHPADKGNEPLYIEPERHMSHMGCWVSGDHQQGSLSGRKRAAGSTMEEDGDTDDGEEEDLQTDTQIDNALLSSRILAKAKARVCKSPLRNQSSSPHTLSKGDTPSIPTASHTCAVNAFPHKTEAIAVHASWVTVSPSDNHLKGPSSFSRQEGPGGSFQAITSRRHTHDGDEDYVERLDQLLAVGLEDDKLSLHCSNAAEEGTRNLEGDVFEKESLSQVPLTSRLRSLQKGAGEVQHPHKPCSYYQQKQGHHHSEEQSWHHEQQQLHTEQPREQSWHHKQQEGHEQPDAQIEQQKQCVVQSLHPNQRDPKDIVCNGNPLSQQQVCLGNTLYQATQHQQQRNQYQHLDSRAPVMIELQEVVEQHHEAHRNYQQSTMQVGCGAADPSMTLINKMALPTQLPGNSLASMRNGVDPIRIHTPGCDSVVPGSVEVVPGSAQDVSISDGGEGAAACSAQQASGAVHSPMLPKQLAFPSPTHMIQAASKTQLHLGPIVLKNDDCLVPPYPNHVPPSCALPCLSQHSVHEASNKIESTSRQAVHRDDLQLASGAVHRDDLQLASGAVHRDDLQLASGAVHRDDLQLASGAVQGCVVLVPPFQFPVLVHDKEQSNNSPIINRMVQQETYDARGGVLDDTSPDVHPFTFVAPTFPQAHSQSMQEIIDISSIAIDEIPALSLKKGSPSTGRTEPSTLLPMKRLRRTTFLLGDSPDLSITRQAQTCQLPKQLSLTPQASHMTSPSQLDPEVSNGSAVVVGFKRVARSVSEAVSLRLSRRVLVDTPQGASACPAHSALVESFQRPGEEHITPAMRKKLLSRRQELSSPMIRRGKSGHDVKNNTEKGMTLDVGLAPRRRCRFLDDEAQLSGEDDEGDEEDEQDHLDSDLDGFLAHDDELATVETGSSGRSPVDMMAIYHRSLMTQHDPSSIFDIGALVRPRRGNRRNPARAVLSTPSTEPEHEVGEEEDEDEELEHEPYGYDISAPTQFKHVEARDSDATPGCSEQYACAACGRPAASGGSAWDLILCDGGCERAYHLRCVGLRALPAVNWICGDCSAAPTPDDEDEAMYRAQRPSQRRKATLKALQSRHWG